MHRCKALQMHYHPFVHTSLLIHRERMVPISMDLAFNFMTWGLTFFMIALHYESTRLSN